MNGDSISAVISISPKATIFRYLVQSIFIFTLTGFAIFGIMFNYGSKDLWTMILVLSISQMLNLPLVDMISLLKEKHQIEKP